MIGGEFEIDQLVQQCDLARANQQLEHQHRRRDARCQPLVARALEQIGHGLVQLHAFVVLARGQIVLELRVGEYELVSGAARSRGQVRWMCALTMQLKSE